MFAQFGDTASYAPLQGGTFEGDMTGWSLNGASVVSGNEPFYVNSATDSHSLSISSNGSATSPSFCASSSQPTYRFVAENLSNSPNATLTVSVNYTGVNGNSSVAPSRMTGAGAAPACRTGDVVGQGRGALNGTPRRPPRRASAFGASWHGFLRGVGQAFQPGSSHCPPGKADLPRRAGRGRPH